MVLQTETNDLRSMYRSKHDITIATVVDGRVWVAGHVARRELRDDPVDLLRLARQLDDRDHTAQRLARRGARRYADYPDSMWV